jgi:hypothetical protein
MAMVFRWPEGRRAAGKWLDSFHVMLWCWCWTCRQAERRQELELTGIVVRLFWCKRVELGGLVSFSGSRWCLRSTGSGIGSGGGGCRRRTGAATEVRRGVKRRRNQRSEIWPQEWVYVVEAGSWLCCGVKKWHDAQWLLLATGGESWRPGGARAVVGWRVVRRRAPEEGS